MGFSKNPEILYALGDQAVARAESCLGSAFLNRPLEARNRDYFYEAYNNIIQSIPDKDGSTNGLVKIVGQGPLPIEIKGRSFMVRAAAFRVGDFEGHEGLGIFSTIDHRGADRSVELHVLVEDHVNLIVQHEGGGSLWQNLDDSLKRMIENGGGVMLLPECFRNVSREGLVRIAKSAAHEVGLSTVKIIDSLGDNHEETRKVINPDMVGDLTKLVDTKITRCEKVKLPWTTQVFVHVEFCDNNRRGEIHHAWLLGEVEDGKTLPVRVHSACSSSEILGAINCDCPDQLDAVFQHIAHEGRGMLLYLDQEARGHGLWAKVQTWPLNIGHQIDLLRAFNAAALREDARDFKVAAEIFRFFGIKSIKLMSNNQTVKFRGLADNGVVIDSLISVPVAPRSIYCEIDHKAKIEDRGDIFNSGGLNYGTVKLRHH